MSKWLLLSLVILYLPENSHQSDAPSSSPPFNEDPSIRAAKRIRCGGVGVEESSWDVMEDSSPDENEASNPADDRSTWKEFIVLFIHDKQIASEDAREIGQAADQVYDRLLPLFKTWPMADVRTPRRWDYEQDRCYYPNTCGGYSIPPEYHRPCYSPSIVQKEYVGEPQVPQDARSNVAEFSKTGFSLVLFVRSPRPNEESPFGCNDEETSAYSNVCFWDKRTLRPTHGYVVLCMRPTHMHMTQLVDLLVHHIVHIMTRGTMLGYYNARVLKNISAAIADEDGPRRVIRRGDIDRMKQIANYDTWRRIVYDWGVRHDGPRTIGDKYYSEIQLATSPNIRRIVREYFGCNDDQRLLGAETSKRPRTSTSPGLVVDELDESHWSVRLFPDELMTPIRTGSPKLSSLTLQIIRDTDWYEVDLNRAQSLMFNYSNLHIPADGHRIVNGCDIATKDCLTFSYPLFRDDGKLMSGNIENSEWIGPLCDDRNGQQQRCSPDGRYRLLCRNFGAASARCGVLHIPVSLDQMDADCHWGVWQSDHSRRLGQLISTTSTCLAFHQFTAPHFEMHNKPWYTGCFQYGCTPDGIRISGMNDDESQRTCTTSNVCPQRPNRTQASSIELQIYPTTSMDATCATIMTGSFVCPHYPAVCRTEGNKLDMPREDAAPNGGGPPSKMSKFLILSLILNMI